MALILNREKALKNLVDADKIFKNAWLDAGTALGAYREQDFISHDKDTDMAILAEDFDLKMVDKMIEKGFSIKHILGTIDNGLEISFIRDGVKLDLFVYYLDGSQRVHSIYQWPKGWIKGEPIIQHLYFYPKELVEEFGRITFLGKRFLIPFNIEEYLKHRYGDW
jgi:phosphorylcholine metabolism protein LicD